IINLHLRFVYDYAVVVPCLFEGDIPVDYVVEDLIWFPLKRVPEAASASGLQLNEVVGLQRFSGHLAQSPGDLVRLLDHEVIGGPLPPSIHPPARIERAPHGRCEARVGVVYPVVFQDSEAAAELALPRTIMDVQRVLLHDYWVSDFYDFVGHYVSLPVPRADQPALAVLPEGTSPSSGLGLDNGEGLLCPIVHPPDYCRTDAEEVPGRQLVRDHRRQRMPHKVGDESHGFPVG